MILPSPQCADETNTTPDGLAVRQKASASAYRRGATGAWRALAGAAVVLLALLGGSGAAQAHDALEGSSPAGGSTVAAMPQAVTLTMTHTPAALGAEIKVVDAAGTNWASGAVSVLDNVATQHVKPGAPAGKYTVEWRLVSSDSHPVEDTFTFTAAAANQGAVAGPAQSAQQVSEAAAQPVADSGGIPWSVFGLMGVLVVVVIAMVVVARRRLGREE